MKTRKRTVFFALALLTVACSTPLDSSSISPLAGDGGTGGSPSRDAPGAGGATIPLQVGGNGGSVTTFVPTSDPRFDPSVLAIDAGGAVDVGGGTSTGIVIFDRSGSMAEGWTTAETDNPDSAVSVSKWVAASRALIGALTPLQDVVTIGAVLFPSDDACAVAPFGDPVQFGFMPARQFLAEYVARAPENQPHGNTPLTVAFQVADQAIQSARAQGILTGKLFVMLLTDGMPNCNSDLSVVLALAESWLGQGIQTYVFGLPGSESARVLLDSVAQAGGTQAIAIPGNPEELQGGMAAAAAP
jgi:hypothetical protein